MLGQSRPRVVSSPSTRGYSYASFASSNSGIVDAVVRVVGEDDAVDMDESSDVVVTQPDDIFMIEHPGIAYMSDEQTDEDEENVPPGQYYPDGMYAAAVNTNPNANPALSGQVRAQPSEIINETELVALDSLERRSYLAIPGFYQNNYYGNYNSSEEELDTSSEGHVHSSSGPGSPFGAVNATNRVESQQGYIYEDTDIDESDTSSMFQSREENRTTFTAANVSTSRAGFSSNDEYDYREHMKTPSEGEKEPLADKSMDDEQDLPLHYEQRDQQLFKFPAEGRTSGWSPSPPPEPAIVHPAKSAVDYVYRVRTLIGSPSKGSDRSLLRRSQSLGGSSKKLSQSLQFPIFIQPRSAEAISEKSPSQAGRLRSSISQPLLRQYAPTSAHNERKAMLPVYLEGLSLSTFPYMNSLAPLSTIVRQQQKGQYATIVKRDDRDDATGGEIARIQQQQHIVRLGAAVNYDLHPSRAPDPSNVADDDVGGVDYGAEKHPDGLLSSVNISRDLAFLDRHFQIPPFSISNDRIFRNEFEFPYIPRTKVECSDSAAVLMIAVFICFPPMWIVLGWGGIDSVVGVVPRRHKIAARVLGSGFFVLAILGITIGLGVGA